MRLAQGAFLRGDDAGLGAARLALQPQALGLGHGGVAGGDVTVVIGGQPLVLFLEQGLERRILGLFDRHGVELLGARSRRDALAHRLARGLAHRVEFAVDLVKAHGFADRLAARQVAHVARDTVDARFLGGGTHRALEFVRHAAQLAHGLTQRVEHLGQVLGTHHDQRHHADDQHLGPADIEHDPPSGPSGPPHRCVRTTAPVQGFRIRRCRGRCAAPRRARRRSRRRPGSGFPALPCRRAGPS